MRRKKCFKASGQTVSGLSVTHGKIQWADSLAFCYVGGYLGTGMSVALCY